MGKFYGYYTNWGGFYRGIGVFRIPFILPSTRPVKKKVYTKLTRFATPFLFRDFSPDVQSKVALVEHISEHRGNTIPGDI